METTDQGPRFETALTRLLGIPHPILCGGLMWLADARYVAAVVNAGAMGFITPRSFPDLDAFRDGLRLCRDLTGGKPFGVNAYISARPEENAAMERFVDIALEEGVRVFETAGRSPDVLLPRLKAAGATVLHKVTEIRHALSAERLGVDAIIFVGGEAGGHPGANTLSSTFQVAASRQRLRVPLVAGGGIGTGGQILAALAAGADGVLLGTRMLVSQEIWAHGRYKERILALDETGTRLVLSSLRNTYRCLDNETAREVAQLEAEGVRDYETLGPHVGGALQRDAYESGDFTRGILSLGPAAVFCDAIEPAAAIVERLIREAVDALDRLRGLTAWEDRSARMGTG